jgi:tetratricopeptide (TPR) repeat protein/S1-C subfamily serine protease
MNRQFPKSGRKCLADGRIRIANILLLSLLCGLLCGTAVQGQTPETDIEKALPALVDRVSEGIDALKPVPNTPDATGRLTHKEIYRRGLRMTAYIVTLNNEGQVTSRATGWLLDKERRVLITNHHVVDKQVRFKVYFPEYAAGRVITDKEHYRTKARGIEAEVLISEPKSDLAALKLAELPENADIAHLADDSPSPGETMLSIGNAGSAQGHWNFTTGTVRQVYRAKLNLDNFLFDAQIIETQSPVNYGDSGGPVFDETGYLVGIVSSFKTEARLVSRFVDVTEVKQFVGLVNRLYDPQQPKDFVDRGVRLRNLGRLQEAIRDFASAVRSKPGYAEALWQRGACFQEMRDYPTALQDYNEAISADPNSFSAYTGRGTIYRFQGKPDEAIADATNAIRLRANSYGARYMRGQCYLDKKEYASAISDFTHGLGLATGNALAIHQLLHDRGRAHELSGQYETARDDYRASLKINNAAVDIYKRLGDLLLDKLKDPAAAVAEYSNALKLQSTSVDVLVQRGRAHSLQRAFEPAFADFNEAVKLAAHEPKALPKALFERGKVYEARGELKPAIDDYRASIRSNGKEAVVHMQLGNLLLTKKKEPGNAVTSFTDALNCQPNQVIQVASYLQRGRAYLQLDQFELALHDLNEAIRLNPKSAHAYKFRGDVNLARQEIDAAITDYQTAVKLDARQAEFHFEYAKALAAKRDHRGALRSLDAAINLAPSFADAYLRRAAAHSELGDSARSEADIRKAAELNPGLRDMEANLPTKKENVSEPNTASAATMPVREVAAPLAQPAPIRRYANYLRVTNATAEPLEIYVYYYTPSVGGNFQWYPADAGANTPVRFQLEPGRTSYISHNEYGNVNSPLKISFG